MTDARGAPVDVDRLAEIDARWSQPAPRAYWGQQKVEDMDWLIAALKGARKIIRDQEAAGASLLAELDRLRQAKEEANDALQRRLAALTEAGQQLAGFVACAESRIWPSAERISEARITLAALDADAQEQWEAGR